MKRYAYGTLLFVLAGVAACGGSDSASDPSADPIEDAGHDAVVDAGKKDGGSTPVSPRDAGDSQTHDDASSPAVADAGEVAAGATALKGTLGASGAIQPIVSSLVISNSGETLIYMTTAALTCEQLKTSRWLGSFSKDAQVVEIVVSGAAKLGAAKNPEVNWALGGKSSAYEQNAKTASVTFTKSEAMGVVEGTVMATYDKPTGDVSGNFHAEFCPDGQGY